MVVGGSLGSAAPAAAQARHVVVVGDSILLGAKDRLAANYSQLGWTATLDMAVSRSTTAGLQAIEAHRSELGDTLVIGLGANDAGNTEAFRDKVQKVLTAVADVPHVFWVTIAEARPYYPAANQVLRDAATSHPNLTVIDWAAYAAATPTVAGSDGLHLTPSGATEMANLVSFETLVASLPKASGPTVRSAPPTTTTTAEPMTEQPGSDDPAKAEPLAPPTSVAQSAPSGDSHVTASTDPTNLADSADLEDSEDSGGPGGAVQGVRSRSETAASSPEVGAGGSPTVGVVLAVALLGLGAAAMGTWAIARARKKPLKLDNDDIKFP